MYIDLSLDDNSNGGYVTNTPDKLQPIPKLTYSYNKAVTRADSHSMYDAKGQFSVHNWSNLEFFSKKIFFMYLASPTRNQNFKNLRNY